MGNQGTEGNGQRGLGAGRALRMLLAPALAAASIAAASNAADMSVCTWLPPSHPMNAVLLDKWTKDVSQATGGGISPKLEYFQGHPKAIFDEVEDGACDVGWSFHGYYPGRFVLTKIAELPLLGAGPEAASAAYWDVHEKYLAKADEHAGLKLLALFTHGPGQIIMRVPISGLADMRGKKVRVGGGIQGDIGSLMGISPVSAPGSKVYEIISQGVADGTFMPIGELNTLRLAEVATHSYLLPEGMYLGSFAIFMNPAFFDSLSGAQQDALMGVSGRGLSAYAGRVWGANDTDGVRIGREAGNEIVELSSADQKAFADMVSGIPDKWHEESRPRGVDTKAALEEFRRKARGG